MARAMQYIVVFRGLKARGERWTIKSVLPLSNEKRSEIGLIIKNIRADVDVAICICAAIVPIHVNNSNTAKLLLW